MQEENVKRLNLILFYENAIEILYSEYESCFDHFEEVDEQKKITVNWSEPIKKHSLEGKFGLNVPITVLIAFSVELSLKALLFQEEVKVRGKHTIKEYYNKLTIDSQNKIRTYYIEKYSDNFDNAMEENDNVFMIWRYPYENQNEEYLANFTFLYNFQQAIKSVIDWSYRP